MTTTTLIKLIVTFCAFKDPAVTREHKELCMEHYVNCSIVEAGQIDLTKCEPYKKKED